VLLGGSWTLEQFGRRLLRPLRIDVERAEADAHQRVRAAASERSRDRLRERPRSRPRLDEHLPTGLRVDAALDEEPRVLLDPRVAHREKPIVRA
jgi:hypothetical protein